MAKRDVKRDVMQEITPSMYLACLFVESTVLTSTTKSKTSKSVELVANQVGVISVYGFTTSCPQDNTVEIKHVQLSV